MTEFSQSEVDRLRARLEVRRQELIDAVRHASSDDSEVMDADGNRMGRLSRAAAMQREEFARDASRRRAQDLARVKTALERVKSGEFGYCLRCGEPISTRRLEADPAVTLCIRCATAEEQR